MKGFNWLNFFLTGDERKEMFRLGAKSACEFLASFEWEKFRKERDKGIHQICNCDDKDLNTNELAGKTKS